MANDNLKIETTEWNGALGYIETIDWLLRTSHVCSMDDANVYDWFMSLEQLSIEVSGQYMTKEEQKVVEEIEDTRKQVLEKYVTERKKLINNPDISLEDKMIVLREIIRPFHLLINKYAHKKGLRMPKKQDFDISTMT